MDIILTRGLPRFLLLRIKFDFSEAISGNRTHDLRFTKPLLYQLSYDGGAYPLYWEFSEKARSFEETSRLDLTFFMIALQKLFIKLELTTHLVYEKENSQMKRITQKHIRMVGIIAGSFTLTHCWADALGCGAREVGANVLTRAELREAGIKTAAGTIEEEEVLPEAAAIDTLGLAVEEQLNPGAPAARRRIETRGIAGAEPGNAYRPRRMREAGEPPDAISAAEPDTVRTTDYEAEPAHRILRRRNVEILPENIGLPEDVMSRETLITEGPPSDCNEYIQAMWRHWARHLNDPNTRGAALLSSGPRNFFLAETTEAKIDAIANRPNAWKERQMFDRGMLQLSR